MKTRISQGIVKTLGRCNIRHLSSYGRQGLKSHGSPTSDRSHIAPNTRFFKGDHLYGISPIRLALTANKRIFYELMVQESMELDGSSNKKDSGANEILSLAAQLELPIQYSSKHDLNMMVDSRPHQGFVLRASPLEFVDMSELPKSSQFKCILALDEVWDPQNFGALLRTAMFMNVAGVVTCSKNSAPLSPTVSKASSGALELMTVHSTNNMMKFLDASAVNGWQIVGTSLGANTIALNELPLQKPTILVLGNEGHGIRTNILNRCHHLVKIGNNVDGLVDSLNVSVAGGILMNHLSKGNL